MKRTILFAILLLVILAASWQAFTSKRPAETESPTVAVVEPEAKPTPTEMLVELLRKELLKEGSASDLGDRRK